MGGRGVVREELARRVRELEPTITSQKEARKAVAAVLKALGGYYLEGNTLHIPRIGTATFRVLPSRVGSNPATGEPIRIPERVYPFFLWSCDTKLYVRNNMHPDDFKEDEGE